MKCSSYQINMLFAYADHNTATVNIKELQLQN